MSNKYRERNDMINWLNEPLNETDIYFDVVSKYYEDLMELETSRNININVDPDYFKIKFLHLLHRHSNTR